MISQQNAVARKMSIAIELLRVRSQLAHSGEVTNCFRRSTTVVVPRNASFTLQVRFPLPKALHEQCEAQLKTVCKIVSG